MIWNAGSILQNFNHFSSLFVWTMNVQKQVICNQPCQSIVKSEILKQQKNILICESDN